MTFAIYMKHFYLEKKNDMQFNLVLIIKYSNNNQIYN